MESLNTHSLLLREPARMRLGAGHRSVFPVLRLHGLCGAKWALGGVMNAKWAADAVCGLCHTAPEP